MKEYGSTCVKLQLPGDRELCYLTRDSSVPPILHPDVGLVETEKLL